VERLSKFRLRASAEDVMGRRSRVPDDIEDYAKLTLGELNAEIARCRSRMDIAPTAYLRKSFFKRTVRLEAYRESLYGIRAPKRTLRARAR
jgi:hypothetical protein